MLSIEQIKKFYPDYMHKFERQLLREYIQHLILNIIYSCRFAESMHFMGGTAIRIIHGSNRFSEDLDFDTGSMAKAEFSDVAHAVKQELELEGFNVEIKIVSRDAYRCYIKFPGLLFDYTLSGHKTEKVMIQMDGEKQPYDYKPVNHLINKFGFITRISVVPVETLLSQKILAFLNRKRTKARDIYDIVYLFSLTEPDLDYLNQMADINSVKLLKKGLDNKCTVLDFEALSKEIEPFLINKRDVNSVRYFGEFVEEM
ncbi:MAG: nucleotidyl transferase AbiEii/AbiGii toxin family protein [candidate division WOR-3 bacterium]|nr:nucleotidyl transferase AbiEii/AbiGii toxin family protein [candidate division WOR-3 bacterium]